ncbi:MAG: FtsW/RodA/SpoVE family cell cycle protein [Candidatus Cryptobacteroides sp.]|nr:FtsW/RodA/SpoVE family cell cycle protein [Bacteroidales bacterium]MDY2860508.1 FtsW/RodA/SpoVE family cell cycle protein [Candidatus Cryptobacteroides sp.]MDY3226540.1 FtsW/RodA/SpoVE family cell cycle protein [Candidatus Cryptobacteroides sp.]MDY4572331.1 FtsW/RodA/SpoVE family cell cycle protein [Candidatus Cryptobacteroides sp.]MDY5262622.1 FtsW/RodA/SpoVE family cell cycle protein [Candidatus Cryptobacteroides sp.]
MAGTRKKAFGFDNLIDWLEGDRIIWIIVFAIIMFSIVGMASSTSLLAKLNSASRFDYAIQQVYISFGGLVLIWLICKFGRVGILKFLSRLGFIGSALLLILLDSHFQGIPFLTPVETQPGSGTWRTIIMFGVPVMVYEVVKVAMVMYLAWALQTLKQKETQLADKLAAFGWLRFLSTEEGKVMFYVGAPMVIVFLLELAGSNSSAIFLGLVMGFTVIVGKMKFKYIFHLILAGVIALGLVFGMQKITGWKFLTRVTTAISRVSDFHGDPVKELHKHEPGTLAFQRILDSSKQVTSAKVAVSTGGLLGKGPGKSTQRYIVSVMYEDYMFSFIIEEYGLLGGMLILILYGTLLARGSIIVRNCDTVFARCTVAGLVALISCQALLHILVNVDLIPMTGQNLPMISHGNSSFLCFCIAFGVILSISRMAKKKIARETANEMKNAPFGTGDETSDSLNDLDDLESREE